MFPGRFCERRPASLRRGGEPKRLLVAVSSVLVSSRMCRSMEPQPFAAVRAVADGAVATVFFVARIGVNRQQHPVENFFGWFPQFGAGRVS